MIDKKIDATAQIYNVRTLQDGTFRITFDLQEEQDMAVAMLTVMGTHKSYGLLSFEPKAMDGDMDDIESMI